jgi:hypothetical protein
MIYRYAKKLHNEDEVLIKKTGEIVQVISIEVWGKDIFVLCSDGNTYHHRELA